MSDCREGADAFIERWFHDCVYNVRDHVGFTLGLCSILCWLFAQVPQYISNYKNKSAEALSPWFLAEWLLGDTCNLLGALLQGQQLPTTLYTAMYFVMMDVFMMMQYIYYGALQRRREKILQLQAARRRRHHHHHDRRPPKQQQQQQSEDQPSQQQQPEQQPLLEQQQQQQQQECSQPSIPGSAQHLRSAADAGHGAAAGVGSCGSNEQHISSSSSSKAARGQPMQQLLDRRNKQQQQQQQQQQCNPPGMSSPLAGSRQDARSSQQQQQQRQQPWAAAPSGQQHASQPLLVSELLQQQHQRAGCSASGSIGSSTSSPKHWTADGSSSLSSPAATQQQRSTASTHAAAAAAAAARRVPKPRLPGLLFGSSSSSSNSGSCAAVATGSRSVLAVAVLLSLGGVSLLVPAGIVRSSILPHTGGLLLRAAAPDSAQAVAPAPAADAAAAASQLISGMSPQTGVLEQQRGPSNDGGSGGGNNAAWTVPQPKPSGATLAPPVAAGGNAGVKGGPAAASASGSEENKSGGAGDITLERDWGYVVGTGIGYLSSVLYLMSRISQIAKNYSRRSAEGLAIAMFCMAMAANLCTGTSILLRTYNRTQLFEQLPWLIGTLGTISLDVVILSQFCRYSGKAGAAAGAEVAEASAGPSGDPVAEADRRGAGNSHRQLPSQLTPERQHPQGSHSVRYRYHLVSAAEIHPVGAGGAAAGGGAHHHGQESHGGADASVSMV